MAISGEFYLVTIGSITFSDDGTETGRACLTQVEGLDKLFNGWIGRTRIPISGDPFNSVAENEGKNVKLITKPFVIPYTQVEALKTDLDGSASADSNLEVVIAQGPGAVSVYAKVLLEAGGEPYIKFGPNGEFFNDDMFNVELRLITAGFIPPEEP